MLKPCKVHLEKLQLLNFKNYEEIALEFPAKVNCLLGLNGSGKTNLLDSIYYLSFTKSFLNSADAQNVRLGADYFLVRGKYDFNGVEHELACQLKQGHKKTFLEDGIEVKLSDHIGKYPVVLISPSDIDLVKDGSDARRKFFDSMISQIDHQYLITLVEYHHCLKQRNSLLKMFQDRNYSDNDLLDSYNLQLVRTGSIIYQKRKVFIEEFLPSLNTAFNFLVEKKEESKLGYQSQLNDGDFLEALKMSYNKDLALQRTSVGIHRDDYYFEFAHGELKRLGSQGQQKSFLVALKLANFEIVKKHKGFNPILLLDDIFDKLDDERISKLLQVVSETSYGQLFITDAGPDRTIALLRNLQINADVFGVNRGNIERR